MSKKKQIVSEEQIVLENRGIEEGFELVFSELKELSNDIKQSLKNGDNLLYVVYDTIDYIDRIKFACTVPVLHIQKSIINEYMEDETTSEKTTEEPTTEK